MKNTENKKAMRELMSWVLTFLTAFVLAMAIRQYVCFVARIPTGSMLNTIQLEDRLFANRLAYTAKDPKRGDIAVFRAPDREKTLYIKRVIGVSGDHVEITDGKIYINHSEEPLNEPYLKDEWIVANDGYVFDVPDGCYLMMGDNRNGSNDARFWENPYISKKMIVARAEFIMYPFSHAGKLR